MAVEVLRGYFEIENGEVHRHCLDFFFILRVRFGRVCV